MNTDIPLYLNHGPNCAEYALLGILEYLEKRKSIEEICEGVGRNSDDLLFPVEIVPFLHREKIPFRYFASRQEISCSLGSQLRGKMIKFYGAEKSSSIIGASNLPRIMRAMEYVLEKDLIDEYNFSAESLEAALSQDVIPLVLINFDVFQGELNQWKGHYITLTGCGHHHFYYDDTGPVTYGKNQKVTKDRLISSLNLVWFDQSVILIG